MHGSEKSGDNADNYRCRINIHYRCRITCYGIVIVRSTSSPSLSWTADVHRCAASIFHRTNRLIRSFSLFSWLLLPTKWYSLQRVWVLHTQPSSQHDGLPFDNEKISIKNQFISKSDSDDERSRLHDSQLHCHTTSISAPSDRSSAGSNRLFPFWEIVCHHWIIRH